MGTPKNIRQAIENGISEAKELGLPLSQQVEIHVIDFIAQKFSWGMLQEICNLRVLYEKITGRFQKCQSVTAPVRLALVAEISEFKRSGTE